MELTKTKRDESVRNQSSQGMKLMKVKETKVDRGTNVEGIESSEGRREGYMSSRRLDKTAVVHMPCHNLCFVWFGLV